MQLALFNMLAAAASPATGGSGGSGGFTFTVSPNAAGAPGGAGIQSGINVIAAYALYACAAGFLLGGLTWAIGKHIGNDYTGTGGKIGMITAAAVAFAIGAAPKILQWTYGLG